MWASSSVQNEKPTGAPYKLWGFENVTFIKQKSKMSMICSRQWPGLVICSLSEAAEVHAGFLVVTALQLIIRPGCEHSSLCRRCVIHTHVLHLLDVYTHTHTTQQVFLAPLPSSQPSKPHLHHTSCFRLIFWHLTILQLLPLACIRESQWWALKK